MLQREMRLKAMRENKEFLNKWHEQNQKIHRTAMTIKRQREMRDEKIAQEYSEKKQRKHMVCDT